MVAILQTNSFEPFHGRARRRNPELGAIVLCVVPRGKSMGMVARRYTLNNGKDRLSKGLPKVQGSFLR